jgi:hypothetical protein
MEKKQKGKKNNNSGKPRGKKAAKTKLPGKESKAPVASSRTIKAADPKIKTLENGDAIISHREYIGEIKAAAGTPSAFVAAGYPINPGQPGSFPWLSRIAANYESYQFLSLKYYYETEAPSSLGGSLVMTVDYDATDLPPVSKQQALTYRGAVRSAPWVSCEHQSKQEDLTKFKSHFVRIGSQPANTDLKTYDTGNLFVISQGVGTAGATLGELHVEYKVLLMTPAFQPDLFIYGGRIQGAGGGLTPANPFGLVPNVDNNAVGISMNLASILTLTYPGTYAVNVYVQGTTLTAITPTAGTGCTVAINVGSADSAGGFTICQHIIVATAPNATVSYAATGASVNASQIWIGTAPADSLS